MAEQGLAVPIIVAALTAMIPGVVALWQARGKVGYDERASYYASIRDDVDDLRARLDLLEGYVATLEGHIDELNQLMIAAGLKPPPRPRRPRAGK